MSSITGENTLTYIIILISILALFLSFLFFTVLDIKAVSAGVVEYIPWINDQPNEASQPIEPVAEAAAPTPAIEREESPSLSTSDIQRSLDFIEYPTVHVQLRQPNIFDPVNDQKVVAAVDDGRCDHYTIPQNQANCLNELYN